MGKTFTELMPLEPRLAVKNLGFWPFWLRRSAAPVALVPRRTNAAEM